MSFSTLLSVSTISDQTLKNKAISDKTKKSNVGQVFTLAGSLPSPPDLRDKIFAARFLPSELPQDVDLRQYVFKVKDQGRFGTCVAHAVSSVVEMFQKRWSAVVEEISPSLIYREGRLISNLPKEIEGMYCRDALKAAYKIGTCFTKDWAYTEENLYQPAPAWIKEYAYQRRVMQYELVADANERITVESDERIHHIKSALAEGLPVLVGVGVSESIRHLTGPWESQNYIPIDATPAGDWIGNHEFVIVGYSNRFQKFICLNSWGSNYGDNGYFSIPFRAVGDIFFEARIIRQYISYGVLEAPGVYLERLNQFKIDARITARQNELGTEVNVWFGVRLVNKQWLLKNTEDDLSFAPPVVVNQVPIYAPCITGLALKEDNPLHVVNWRDMSAIPGLAGAEVWVAYGRSPMDWQLKQICTIPAF